MLPLSLSESDDGSDKLVTSERQENTELSIFCQHRAFHSAESITNDTSWNEAHNQIHPPAQNGSKHRKHTSTLLLQHQQAPHWSIGIRFQLFDIKLFILHHKSSQCRRNWRFLQHHCVWWFYNWILVNPSLPAEPFWVNQKDHTPSLLSPTQILLQIRDDPHDEEIPLIPRMILVAMMALMAMMAIGTTRTTNPDHRDAGILMEEVHPEAIATTTTTIADNSVVVLITTTVVVEMILPGTKEISKMQQKVFGNRNHKNQNPSPKRTLISTARRHWRTRRWE